MIWWRAEIRWDLLCWFSINPSFKWRIGDTVNMKFISGLTFLIKEIIDERLLLISTIDNSSFLNLCWGTLWQLVTILPDSEKRYIQDVPSVIMIWVLLFKAVFINADAWLSWFKASSFDEELNFECAVKDCHRSLKKKISFSVYSFLQRAFLITDSIAFGWNKMPKGLSIDWNLW